MKSRCCIVSLLIVSGACVLCAADTPVLPLLKVLDQFVASDVPATGPVEIASERNWDAPTTPPPERPGHGLAEHPMLYAGEGHNTLFVVNGGKVIWSYACGKGGEIDDVWLMTNGHILYTRQNFIEEVTPRGLRRVRLNRLPPESEPV